MIIITMVYSDGTYQGGPVEILKGGLLTIGLIAGSMGLALTYSHYFENDNTSQEASVLNKSPSSLENSVIDLE